MAVEWRQQMAVDHGVIDDDHRRLISIINSFERAHATPWDLTAVLEDLRLYATRHFRREERLQREVGFPEAASHHREHERLLARLAEIIDEFQAASRGDIQQVAAHTSQLLADWLIDHIIKNDLKMRPFVAPKARFTAS